MNNEQNTTTQSPTEAAQEMVGKVNAEQTASTVTPMEEFKSKSTLQKVGIVTGGVVAAVGAAVIGYAVGHYAAKFVLSKIKG